MIGKPSEDVPPGGESYAVDELRPGWVVLAALLVALPFWLVKKWRAKHGEGS